MKSCKKHYKILLSILVVVILSVLPLSATAKTVTKTVEGVTFSVSDSFKIFTADALESPKDVEGFVFAAISGDNEHQLQCRRIETEFSKQIGSFQGVQGDDLKPVGEKIFTNSFSTAEVGNRVYLKSTSIDGNQFNVIYVTVSDGKLYTFSYFGSDPTVIGEFVATVTVPDSVKTSPTNILMIVVFSIAILGFAALLVVLILSFVKDYRRRKMEQSENIVSNYIKIKRRKY